MGNINQAESVISLDKDLLEKMDDSSSCSDVKSNYTKSLMVALQNQNINEHIDLTLKKADFLKKTINNSIKIVWSLIAIKKYNEMIEPWGAPRRGP